MPINGRAGTRYVNDTTRVMWQLRVLGVHTCSYCWSLDGQIADFWPIPLHRNCRCNQYPIYPGEKAPLPFVDYRKRLDKLGAGEKSAAVGASVARLVKAGLIGWGATVGPDGVLTLASIVAAHHLTLKQLLKAGIPAWIARRAIDDGKPEPAAPPRPGIVSRIVGGARRILHRFRNLFGGNPAAAPSAPVAAPTAPHAGPTQASELSAAIAAYRLAHPRRRSRHE